MRPKKKASALRYGGKREEKNARLIVQVVGQGNKTKEEKKKEKKRKGDRKERMDQRTVATSPATIHINKQTFRPCNAFLRRPVKIKLNTRRLVPFVPIHLVFYLSFLLHFSLFLALSFVFRF